MAKQPEQREDHFTKTLSLEQRIDRAAREYVVPRQHPALAGLIQPIEPLCERYRVFPEAVFAYIESGGVI